MSDVEELARKSKSAAARIATASTEQKNEGLFAMADALEQGIDRIITDNGKDLSAGGGQGISSALMDRLTLDESRVKEMAEGLREVAGMRDPVGEVVDGWK
ncbi:MAG: gamma-glutamyl-phosphate reductase, partial [Actinobacteria bacterium]|nr:gamma-glutamyl-phosphate reductase [Actinomycetota bacterium]